MKRILFITFLVSCIWLVGQSAGLADNTPPSVPQWDLDNGPYIVFTDTEIALYWQPSSSDIGLEGYYIYRCQGVNCTMPSQPTFVVDDPNAFFYADGTVTAGTTYSYTIAAYDIAGNISAQSTIVVPGYISDQTGLFVSGTTGTASNIVPVITLAQPTVNEGSVGQNLTFNMRQSNLSTGGVIYGNSAYSWNWDFGDGSGTSSDSDVSHTYSKAGTYTLSLNIYNNNTGDQATVEQPITVLPSAVTGLTLRLSFNGDINDYSGNQLQTTALGAGIPAFTVGVTGLAADFDGTADGPYISVSDNGQGLLDGNMAASIALFAKKNSSSAAGSVFVKQGVYSLNIAPQGLSASLTNTNGVIVSLYSSSVANNDTNWHHYALTYDGTNATLYFDGSAVASHPMSGNLIQAPGTNVLIGETISGNTFNGSLDTVRFYNQALTPVQVANLYNGTQYGDVDGDGQSTIYDANLTSQYTESLITLTPTQLIQAEVSADISPTIYDAELIAQKAVGLILKYPADINEE